MTGWIERLVLAWLRAVAPRGWTDTVVGDLREDIDGRRGFARLRAVAATAGVATRFTFETEYELLLTNRLILQPLVELDVHGKDDRERGIGAGLSEIETGLRLRYEIRRGGAPYVGVTWHRKTFGTADLAREEGERVSGARVAVGLRLWY